MSLKGLVFDGIATSSAIDSSGEVLNVEGCDISELDKTGMFNYEHLSAQDAQGKKVLGQEKVGKILYARKLLKASDCETDRQQHYWQQLGGDIPCVYVVGRLFDMAGHEAARALAASMRDQHANGEKILLRLSIEGGTTKRDGQELVETYGRDIALTYKPCNRTCDVGLLLDPGAPEGYDEEPYPADKLRDLLGLKKGEDPAEFAQLAPRLLALVALHRALAKTLTAGSTNAAPGALVGGAALQREDRGLRARAEKLRRDYGAPFDKEEFQQILRQHLPEADDEFIEHFSDLVDEVKVPAKVLKMQAPLQRAAATVTPDVLKSENPHVTRPFVDFAAGAIHTPRGTFSARLDERAQLAPAAEDLFWGALEGWARANAALRAGVPSEPLLRLLTVMNGKPSEDGRAQLAAHAARYRVDGRAAAEEFEDPAAWRAMWTVLGGARVVLLDEVVLGDLFGAEAVGALSPLLRAAGARDLREGVDRLYVRHAAVRELRAGKWAGLFSSDDEALTPACWARWLAAVSTSPLAPKAGVGGLWRASDPFAKAEGDWVLPKKCAEQMSVWGHHFGQVGAVLLGLRYLVPRLLGRES